MLSLRKQRCRIIKTDYYIRYKLPEIFVSGKILKNEIFNLIHFFLELVGVCDSTN